jgi:transposase-like protein
MIIQLPKIERNNFKRPEKCPYCQGETFQGWGTIQKKIKDTKIRKVNVKRYRCTSCQKTFRQYPEGVSHAQQSERLMRLCVIMWGLGLSYRGVELILSAFGVRLSHMSGWRDVQEEGKRIRRRMKWKPARVVGIDGAWMKGTGVMVAVDLGDGQLLSIAEINEKDKEAVEQWLKSLKQRHKIGVIVTDDLGTYKEIAEELELGHQICQFHVRRWVGKYLKQAEKEIPPEWKYVIVIIRQLIDQLPTTGGKVLHKVWQELPGRTTKPNEKRTPLEKLRDVVLRLSRDWEHYIEFYSDPGIPWTNNQTEQVIGKLKNRAKRVRGYKTSQGQLTGSLIASQSWF